MNAWRICAALVTASVAVVGCTSSEVEVAADRCIVRVHGKGGGGEPPQLVNGIAVLAPEGNGEGWGGRQWDYATADDLSAATDVISGAVDDAGCERVVLHGFSNGASLVAAMICTGTTLDGRLVGAVIDDPVTDEATVGCQPSAEVDSVVYWTGALDEAAPPGTSCDAIDWTCKGNVVRGIEPFAREIGVTWMRSPFSAHRWHLDAPEPLTWLAD
jgi:hypothetical protein